MVERAIEYFSYAGLLVILLLASLGLPVPEEVPIITAGILSHEGILRWWLALPTCIAGVLAGDLILYGAGRHWGERVLEHRLLGRLLTRERLEEIEAGYRRRGLQLVVLSSNVVAPRECGVV